jgi:hypothetical protein
LRKTKSGCREDGDMSRSSFKLALGVLASRDIGLYVLEHNTGVCQLGGMHELGKSQLLKA